MINNDISGDATFKSPVRLRRPDRLQSELVVSCPDDLVSKTHPVRNVAAVVATMDLSLFSEPIKAREGNAGRDATDPALLVSLWVYGNIRGIGSARELARRCLESRPFQWLCGGVGVNHHLLSDFRVDHSDALDELFSQVIASLVDKKLVKVRRISQDGLRVRAGAGASSFRRESTLTQLLKDAQERVDQLRKQVDDPEYSAAVGAAKAAAVKRAAEDRASRLQQAIEQMPELKKKQEQAAKKAGRGKRGQEIRDKQPRVSTTDPDARVMKMPNGGFNPAFNVQLASDMSSDEAKEVYKQRASTSESVDADLRCQRGLGQMAVRGLPKARCVALWCALAYNMMHFGVALLR